MVALGSWLSVDLFNIVLQGLPFAAAPPQQQESYSVSQNCADSFSRFSCGRCQCANASCWLDSPGWSLHPVQAALDPTQTRMRSFPETHAAGPAMIALGAVLGAAPQWLRQRDPIRSCPFDFSGLAIGGTIHCHCEETCLLELLTDRLLTGDLRKVMLLSKHPIHGQGSPAKPDENLV